MEGHRPSNGERGRHADAAIDMHSHYHGEEAVSWLRRRRDLPCIESGADGRAYLRTSSKRIAFPDRGEDVAARLAFMDGLGIGRQLVAFPGNMGLDVLPIAEAADGVRAVNDELAAVRRRHPERFSTLAGLPLDDLDAAVEELRRARLEQGHLGVILPAGYFQSRAHAERLAPLFEAADELAAHVLVHPGPRGDERDRGTRFADADMLRASVLELQHAVSHALVTLALSDFLDPYPAVSVQLINLGGTVPFLVERMEHVARVRTPAAATPLRPRLRRVHVDSASLGPRALALAVEVFGADRVMLGTDYPFFPTSVAREAVDAAGLCAGDRALVLRGTADALLARERGAVAVPA